MLALSCSSRRQLSQEVFDNLWFDAQKHLKNLGVGVLSLNARTRDLQVSASCLLP